MDAELKHKIGSHVFNELEIYSEKNASTKGFRYVIEGVTGHKVVEIDSLNKTFFDVYQDLQYRLNAGQDFMQLIDALSRMAVLSESSIVKEVSDYVRRVLCRIEFEHRTDVIERNRTTSLPPRIILDLEDIVKKYGMSQEDVEYLNDMANRAYNVGKYYKWRLK